MNENGKDAEAAKAAASNLTAAEKHVGCTAVEVRRCSAMAEAETLLETALDSALTALLFSPVTHGEAENICRKIVRDYLD